MFKICEIYQGVSIDLIFLTDYSRSSLTNHLICLINQHFVSSVKPIYRNSQHTKNSSTLNCPFVCLNTSSYRWIVCILRVHAIPNHFVCCTSIMILLLKELLHIHMKYEFKNQGRNLGGSCSESILTENAFQNTVKQIYSSML